MGEISGEWPFVVWMGIVVVMLIIIGIRYYWARRNMPKNPEDKRTNRKIALETLKFFLGIKEKTDDDISMKHHRDEGGTLFK